MKLLPICLSAFCLLTKPAFCQNFLPKLDKKISYQGYDDCLKKITRWKPGDDKVSMKYEATRGDTIIFRFNFHALLSVKSDYPQSDSQAGMRLKYCKNCILMSYPSDWLAITKDLPGDFKLVDLEEKEGTSSIGREHFFYDEFKITLESKKYDSFLGDTILHYSISGKKTIYHAVLIQGFLFCRKYGFIRWNYGLEAANVNKCNGYIIDKRFRKYLLRDLQTQIRN